MSNTYPADWTGPRITYNDFPDPDLSVQFDRGHFGQVVGQDNVWLTLDDLFCVNIIRTDEGIVIDVWPKEENLQLDAPVATTYAYETDVLGDTEEARQS